MHRRPDPGAAVFLEEWRAATNPSEYQILEGYCSEVVRKNVVEEDGPLITAGAMPFSIDLVMYVKNGPGEGQANYSGPD